MYYKIKMSMSKNKKALKVCLEGSGGKSNKRIRYQQAPDYLGQWLQTVGIPYSY